MTGTPGVPLALAQVDAGVEAGPISRGFWPHVVNRLIAGVDLEWSATFRTLVNVPLMKSLLSAMSLTRTLFSSRDHFLN